MIIGNKKILKLITFIFFVVLSVFLSSWNIAKAAPCITDHSVLGVPQDWTIPTGTVLDGVHCGINNLTIAAGSTVTVRPWDGANYGRVEIDVSGNATIAGTLSANGVGYSNASGPGAGGGGGWGGGGGHGGRGGTGNGAVGGNPNDGIKVPNNMGSGGGNASDTGGKGGGVIILDVSTGTLTVTGNVTVNGANGGGGYSGGGAGGTIYITAGTLAGAIATATISADGGAKAFTGGGGGGGGRVAIYYTDKTYVGKITAYGGLGTQAGGAGTIFQKSASQTNGSLLVDNTNRSRVETSFDAAPYTFDTLSIINQGNLTVPSGASITTLDSGAWSTEGLTVYGSFTANSVNDFTIKGPVNVNTSTTMTSLFPAGTVTIKGAPFNGVLSHVDNSAVPKDGPKVNYIDWTLTNLTIENGGAINVDGKGYKTLTGINNGTPAKGGWGGGGGHGGIGGAVSGGGLVTGGLSNDSITTPVYLGSAGGEGGSSSPGGMGGGFVKLNVTTLTVNGSITANGIAPVGPSSGFNGGGAGGTVYIIANSLAGTNAAAVISANGGRDGSSGGGGGGGGRVAIYYTNKTYTGQVRAYGGLGAGTNCAGNCENGGAGTIYWKNPTQTNGDLIIDNNILPHTGRAGTSFAVAAYTFDTVAIQNWGNLIVPSGGSVVALNSGAWTIDGLTVNGSFAANSVNNLTINGPVNINASTSMTSLFPNGSVTITSTGVLSHVDNSSVASGAPKVNYIDWTLSNFTINNGGSINVNGKGYVGGRGIDSGVPPTTAWGGGGGHGGFGGAGSNIPYTAGGSANDSIVAPVYLGSGGASGAASSPGGTGGGFVKLNISGTLTINGNISANATSGVGGFTGGGAGGTIYLSAGTFAGTNAAVTISANGGNKGAIGGGGGAGGRIAIYYATKSYTGRYAAYGGLGGGCALPNCQNGGAGTIYFKASSQSYGDLKVDNNTVTNGASTPIIAAHPNNLIFDDLTLQNYAFFAIPAGKTVTTSNFNLNSSGTFSTVGSMTTSNLTVTGNFNLSTSLSVNPTRTIYFNSSNPTANLNILSGGVLSHDANTNSKSNYIDWSLNDLTIYNGGSINVNAKGYSAGNGIGGGAGSGSGGGGHGGAGGGGGAINDSTTAPVNLGSAGAAPSGGAGGGYVKLALNSATVNGTIVANGANAVAAGFGGGAGGSIWLNISGGFSGSTGNITANGGNGNGGGGGGGGIIYISRDPNSGRLYGWARFLTACQDNLWNGTACTGSGAGDKSGGWDGWVSLNSANCDSDNNGKVDSTGACGGDNSTTLVQNYKVTLSGNDFKGWAWGSDVVGWLSFNARNCDTNGDGFSEGGGGCPASGTDIRAYKVYLNFPPILSNLSTNEALIDYCSQPVTAITLSWMFADVEDGNTQTAYQVIITRDDLVTYNTGMVTGVGGSATSITGAAINIAQPGFIDFNHTYNWTVKVWDSGNLSDGPTSGPAFVTPVHKYPDVEFICSPSTTDCPPKHADYEEITFTSQSVCYTNNNVVVPCSDWTWDFCQGDTCANKNASGATALHSYESVGGVYIVDLLVSDGLYSCNMEPPKTINALKQRWKEVVPTN